MPNIRSSGMTDAKATRHFRLQAQNSSAAVFTDHLRSAIRALAVLSQLVLALSSVPAAAQTVDQVRDRGLAWLIQNQRNDGSWGAKPELFVSNTALGLRALQVAGFKQSSYPRASATTWLLNVNAASVDSLARQVESLAASGANMGEKILLLEAARNPFFAWGGYAGFD